MKRTFLWLAIFCSIGCASTTPPSPCPTVAPAIALSRTVDADPTGEWEIRWDRTFAGWKPPIFSGGLSLKKQNGEWVGALGFEQSSAKLKFRSVKTSGDRIDILFSAEDGISDTDVELSGWVREDRIVGEMRWGKAISWTPFGARRTQPTTLESASVDHSLPAIESGQASIDVSELNLLLDHATAQKSSAIVILQDGKVVTERYRSGYAGDPIVAMSASKSIVSIAIGMLIAEKKLSLETRMDALFPEWKSLGPKSAITVRQLLTHTSGLDDTRANFETETIREHALKSKLVYPPGTRFQYNNNAVDFLGVVVRQAAGIPLDAYLESHLFQPLDVVGAHWMKDSEGNPRGAGELFIRPIDLAKIGQLLLDHGMWEGKVADTLNDSVLSAWRDIGIASTALVRAQSLVGKKFATKNEYLGALRNVLGYSDFPKLMKALHDDDHFPFRGRVFDGPVRGYSARGWLGQFLIVLPAARIVAVRMRASDSADKLGTEINGYPAFSDDVAALAQRLLLMAHEPRSP